MPQYDLNPPDLNMADIASVEIIHSYPQPQFAMVQRESKRDLL